MYEKLTCQSLPNDSYRELIGTAICAFNQNNAFVIENILLLNDKNNWHYITNHTSGKILDLLRKALKEEHDDILVLFRTEKRKGSHCS